MPVTGSTSIESVQLVLTANADAGATDRFSQVARWLAKDKLVTVCLEQSSTSLMATVSCGAEALELPVSVTLFHT